MRRILCWGFLAACFFLAEPSIGFSKEMDPAGTPHIWGDFRAGAGEAALIWIAPAGRLRDVVFSLMPEDRPDGRGQSDGRVISRGRMAPWEPVPGRRILLGTLAVPAGVAPGDYTLVLKGQHRLRPWRAARSITVRARSRGETDLFLSRRMSRILRAPDPSKAEQARRLWKVLGRFQPSALHHSAAFVLPVRGHRISSPFGFRRRYCYPDGEKRVVRHNGVDLAVPAGTPVRSCGAGRVVLAEDRIITGKTVVVEHWPGVFSLYYHLQRILPAAGDLLATGDVLGEAGSTGFSTGPHLHWEVRIFGIPTDPMALLQRPLVDKSLILSKIGIYTKKRGGDLYRRYPD